jgi:hypothetical protein
MTYHIIIGETIMITREQLLKSICDRKRVYTKSPFRYENYIGATNSRLLLLIPEEKNNDYPETQLPIKRVLSEIHYSLPYKVEYDVEHIRSAMNTLPRVRHDDLVELYCVRCNSNGAVDGKICEQCKGSGIIMRQIFPEQEMTIVEDARVVFDQLAFMRAEEIILLLSIADFYGVKTITCISDRFPGEPWEFLVKDARVIIQSYNLRERGSAPIAHVSNTTKTKGGVR